MSKFREKVLGDDTPPPDPPEIYYDSARKEYWLRDASGRFMQINENSLKKRLKNEGFSAYIPEGKPLSEIDQAVIKIQNESRIHYAGPLAGHFTGGCIIEGRRILVTESPVIIEPKEGDWPILNKLISNLLGPEQEVYLYGWLKIAYESLKSGKHRPGQALVIAGERNCGKSLFQKIITEILGGRSGKPYQFMMDGTNFNSDLFTAEHLILDDEASKLSTQKRREFGAKLKGITTEQKHWCHPKHRDALMLTPFWRLTVSLNDEPENLMVLPPLDVSLGDKMILFRANKAKMPMPTHTNDQREAFWNQILSELPAMLHAIMVWEIPEELLCGRFGITHYHHPEILDALEELSPETRLQNLIDSTFFAEGCREPQQMRSEVLVSALRERFPAEVSSLLSWYRACGTYLGRLATKHPERVRQARSKGVTTWILYPPSPDSTDEPKPNE